MEQTLSLGDRMKMYEKQSRTFLPEKSYTIIRLDGKNFSKFTKQFKRPFDDEFTLLMNQTAIELCRQIQGAKFAYVQSDEISILMTDIDAEHAQLWFGGAIQKITSVSAAIASATFNKERMMLMLSHLEGKLDKDLDWDTAKEIVYNDADDLKTAAFDSRVFVAPNKWEVYNAFLWRQRDFTRNSVSMACEAIVKGNLHGKSLTERLKMLEAEGVDWSDYPQQYKAGRLIVKESYEVNNEYGTSIRNRWVAKAAHWFGEDRDILLDMIPEKFVEHEV